MTYIFLPSILGNVLFIYEKINEYTEVLSMVKADSEWLWRCILTGHLNLLLSI